MTADKIALRELLEKGSDTSFLREMIGFAAERLMVLETEELCGAAPGERSAERRNQRRYHVVPSGPAAATWRLLLTGKSEVWVNASAMSIPFSARKMRTWCGFVPALGLNSFMRASHDKSTPCHGTQACPVSLVEIAAVLPNHCSTTARMHPPG